MPVPDNATVSASANIRYNIFLAGYSFFVRQLSRAGIYAGKGV